MAGSTNPDALMFREAADGTAWDVLRIAASRIAECEARGWIVLVSSVPREPDIWETYGADLARFDRRVR